MIVCDFIGTPPATAVILDLLVAYAIPVGGVAVEPCAEVPHSAAYGNDRPHCVGAINPMVGQGVGPCILPWADGKVT